MPETRKYSTAGARSRFADIVNEAAYGKERIVLTRRGKDVAAVIPMSDLELLYELERLIDLQEAKEAIIEAEASETVPLAELKKRLKV